MHGRGQLEFKARSRAGFAARVLVTVLCGIAFAGPAAAQTTHADLETAVAAFTEALVLRGGLRGGRVIVGPRYFFDEDSKRHLPLSEFLSRQFQARLLAHDVTPVEPGGSEDEDRMMVLHGRWRLLGEGLHLTAHVREPIVEGSGTVASAPPARVRDFDESLLALDLGFLGRDMVRQLEGGIHDGRHRDIHLGEFTIEGEGVGDSEPVRRYLTAFWLRPAFRDSLFTLRSGVPVGGEGHGVLFVYAYATSEHLKVSMHVEGAGERVPTATVDVPVELVPVLGGPDIEAMLARCEGQAEAGRLPEAWSCYGEVPKTAAGSAGAGEGRARIEERYAARVRKALGVGDFETAAGIAGELSGLTPRPVRARVLEAEVARALESAEREAEERRAAAEAKRKREAEAKRKAEAERRRAEERRIAELMPEMVRIEAGCFQMGSPESETGRGDDERRHRVCVEAFSMGKHEVTRGQYAAFVRETGRAVGDACGTYEGGEWKKRTGRSWRSPGYGQEDTHPVVCVSHEEAVAYARWLSGETGLRYRLPTEAEWEYAARAGSTTAYPWGNGVGGDRANCNGCGSRWDNRQTAPVGSFDANAWGLYDTVGNVWEWTCSEYDEGYGGAEQRCTSGSEGRRVIRGGSWSSGPGRVRSAARLWSDTDFLFNFLGFRLAQD